MEYRQLGGSGLEVSRVILGCMSFGEPEKGNHPWSLGLDESRSLVRRALDLGITTFDTANVYSAGSSEDFVGTLIKSFVPRDEVVVATKVYGRTRPGPNGAGLSRLAIMREVDRSLQRLQTDYIDLYQIHRFDPRVPIEETMEALHDIVKSGKVRYIGASSMSAWQFAEMQQTAARRGWPRFVSMHDHYNLIARESEREMHPYCAYSGMGVIPWSPLARGKLARSEEARTPRSSQDVLGEELYNETARSDARIIDAVGEIARRREVSRAQVALAWVLSQKVVTGAVVGATRKEHLDDAVSAVALELNGSDLAQLADPYVPREVRDFYF